MGTDGRTNGKLNSRSRIRLLNLSRLYHDAAIFLEAFKGRCGQDRCIFARFMDLACILYRCGLKVLHSIHCGASPQIGPKKTKRKVTMTNLYCPVEKANVSSGLQTQINDWWYDSLLDNSKLKMLASP